MAKRWRDPAGFRVDPHAAAATRPSRRQAVALVTGLVLLAGSVIAASYVFQPDKARSFDLFHGSLFLNDNVAPVAIDLATGQPTVQLVSAGKQVGLETTDHLTVAPVDNGTILLNTGSGEFNLVDSTGFVVKSNTGVQLPPVPGGATATAIASGPNAFIVQNGTRTSAVYLVTPATVRVNAGSTAQARGFLTLANPIGAGHTAVDDGSAVSADEHLWLLVDIGNGTTTTHRIYDLSLPADSAPGVRLIAKTHGSPIEGPTALTTTRASDDSTAVGVASADGIRVFSGGKAQNVRFPQPVAGLAHVEGATNASGRLAFLLQDAGGWLLTSVQADGKGLKRPQPLDGIPAGADLAPPAWSENSLYTVDRATGALYQIGPDGTVTTPGIERYPVNADGARDFKDAVAVARGPRVIYNSPSHTTAVVVFTDHSRPPLQVVKQNAVKVSAVGGVQALTESRNLNSRVPPAKPVGAPKPVAPVDPISNAIICSQTTQPPHKPSVVITEIGSRSVTVGWHYPTVGREDCIPSRYDVTATPTADDNLPTKSVRVLSQTGGQLTGLLPETKYEVKVTAWINTMHTDSDGVPFTTIREGPAAPRNVRVTTDSAGGWTISWTSCGTLRDGCVPSDSWNVIPQICDGIGLAAPPATLNVPADPTSSVQPPGRYVATPDLLGRRLTFRVQGVGSQGEQGAVSDATPCTGSWRTPAASALGLTASVKQDAGAAAVTAVLGLGASPTVDVGGLGASVTFLLTGNGTQQSSGAISYSGATDRLSATFGTVAPGIPYTVSAVVSPPGHPEVIVPIAPVAISTSADWPTPALQVGCDPTSLVTCDLKVSITNISSQGANGELFTLTPGSGIVCGNTTKPITTAGPFDPSQGPVVTSLSQVAGYYGQCTVAIALQEATSSPTPFYGNVVSPTASATIDLGTPATSGAGQGDFVVNWSPTNGSSAEVRYTGPRSAPELALLTTGWSETLTAPNGDPCGAAAVQPGADDASAAYVPVPCLATHGSETSGWTVTVAYTDTVGGAGHSFTYGLTGGPPGFVPPCNLVGLTASWGATQAAGVSVTVDPSSDLSGCQGWDYELAASDGTACNDTSATRGLAPPQTLSLTCSNQPDTQWTLTLAWIDGNGIAQSQQVAVTGDPPTA